MNTAEIVAAMRAQSPEAVEGLTDTAVKKLVAAVLAVVRDGIAAAQPGRLMVSGLGRFNVKAGSKEVDGQTQDKRKVAFQPAKDRKADPAARQARMAARKSARAEQNAEHKAEKKAGKKAEKKAA